MNSRAIAIPYGNSDVRNDRCAASLTETLISGGVRLGQWPQGECDGRTRNELLYIPRNDLMRSQSLRNLVGRFRDRVL
jgi:hypothetical protein